MNNFLYKLFCSVQNNLYSCDMNNQPYTKIEFDLIGFSCEENSRMFLDYTVAMMINSKIETIEMISYYRLSEEEIKTKAIQQWKAKEKLMKDIDLALCGHF